MSSFTLVLRDFEIEKSTLSFRMLSLFSSLWTTPMLECDLLSRRYILPSIELMVAFISVFILELLSCSSRDENTSVLSDALVDKFSAELYFDRVL